MKNILILGSAGQIGGHLTYYLKKKNYKVFQFDIVDNISNDLRIKNNQKLIKLVKKTDYVFFLAFDVGGSVYLKKFQFSKQFLFNNLQIMTNTFEILSRYKKPFLFASSQMSNMTYSNYGILKLIGEKVTDSINGIYVKFWNVYGIEKDKRKSHVITDFINKAFRQKKINMLTDGLETREFLYADDCCNGLEIIMKNHNKFKKNKNELHLTTGIKTKIKDIAEIIKANFKKRNILVKIVPSKAKDTVQLNKNNINNNFLKKYWKPKTNMREGIDNMIKYYESKS